MAKSTTHILNKLGVTAFDEPPARDIKYIVFELGKSGKYNRRFIDSLTAGLKRSEYFNQ